MSHPPATAHPAPRRIGEVIGIQYLRGIAALMVVIFHLEPQLRRMDYRGPWAPGLSGGVDIFFVISGFIMWVTTCGKPIGPLDFWQRRIVRIVPLYWLFTSFMVAMMLIAPKVLQTSRFDFPHILASYLFFPWHHPLKPALEPVVMPGWTLNYEMFFYFLFGLFLLAPPRARFLGTVGTLLLLVLVGAAAGAQPLTAAGFYTSSLMLEFAMGMVLGLTMTRGDLFERVPAWLGWLLLIAGLLAVAFLHTPVEWPRLISRGVAAMATVGGMLVLEAHRRVSRMPVLHALGNSSYSLYLSHVVTLSATSQAWRLLRLQRLPEGWLLYSLFAVLVSAVVGYGVYRFIEQPLTSLFRTRPRAGVEVAPARAGA